MSLADTLEQRDKPVFKMNGYSVIDVLEVLAKLGCLLSTSAGAALNGMVRRLPSLQAVFPVRYYGFTRSLDLRLPTTRAGCIAATE